MKPELFSIVRLVCGSFAMVVTLVNDGNRTAQCEWHDNDGIPRHEEYPWEVLNVENSRQGLIENGAAR